LGRDPRPGPEVVAMRELGYLANQHHFTRHVSADSQLIRSADLQLTFEALIGRVLDVMPRRL
jgi:hypothetical protein